VRLGARQFGPNGERPEIDNRRVREFWSEADMAKFDGRRHLNANLRTVFKRGLGRAGLKGIPRDVGEIPRNYTIKILHKNEPVTIAQLFTHMKEHDDCPVDSQRHLRFVLRVARMHDWVYVEKNQTNNQWYYYTHPKKKAAIQELLLQERDDVKEIKHNDALLQKSAKSDAERQREEYLDRMITAMQKKLADNVCSLRDYDPDFVEGLPYHCANGAVNVAWHHEAATNNSGSNKD
jgi:hypothetical protein